MNVQWEGVVAVEGDVSVDRRMLLVGALTWRVVDTLPLTRNNVRVGSVETLRRAGSLIIATGTADVELEVGDPLAAFVDGIVRTKREDDVVAFQHGRLRSVELTSSRPAWDLCRVTRVAY